MRNTWTINWSIIFFTATFISYSNDDGDFSDVESLLCILNDNIRNTDPEAWCTSLESVLDVDIFLKYLAVNTTIQNWDTYGRMTHNYFLG